MPVKTRLPVAADFPALTAAQNKLYKLEAARASLAAEYNEARRTNSSAAIAAAANQLLTAETASEVHVVFEVSDLAELERELKVFDAAILQQKRVVNAERGNAAAEVSRSMRPEHNRLLGRLVDAARLMIEAMEDEARFRRHFPLVENLPTDGEFPAPRFPMANFSNLCRLNLQEFLKGFPAVYPGSARAKRPERDAVA